MRKILSLFVLIFCHSALSQQGTSVRSLNGTATNFSAIGGLAVNVNVGPIPKSWFLTNIGGSFEAWDGNVDRTFIIHNGLLGFNDQNAITQFYINTDGSDNFSMSSNIFPSTAFSSGIPGFFATQSPGYMGNYDQNTAWTSLQAVNPLFPIPWNQHFTGSINGGDATTNIVMRMGWNVSPTGTVIDTTHASLNLLMEGNEDDVGTEHVSTFVVEANYPDGYVFAPLDISIDTSPSDPDYKTASFQSGFNFWTMYHPLLPTTNLVTLQITPGNADLHFNQLGRFIWDTQADHDLLRVNGDADLMKWSHGLGEIEVFNETSSNFRVQNGGYLQVEGRLCVGTNANGGAINLTNQVSISTPFQKDVFVVATNGTTYIPTAISLTGTSTSNVILGNSGAFVRTNFISGQLYTNLYGAPIQVSTKAILTLTGVSGDAAMALEMAGNDTNASGITTAVGTVAATYTNVLSGIVTNNGTYVFTNRSVGAGDSATILGGQIIIY